jgi:hypothetical protein
MHVVEATSLSVGKTAIYVGKTAILISSAIPSENFQQTGRDENHSYCLRPLVEVPDIKKKSSLDYSRFKRDFGINECIKSTSAKIVTFTTVFESFKCFLGKAYFLHKCSN